LKGIETLLKKIDSSQGIIIGSDWNNFTDRIKDQRGNQAKPHYRTKATAIHMDWKTENKFLDIYRRNNPEGKDLTYLNDNNRRRTDKGSRLDKFLLSEDLCIKEIDFDHIRDYFYTEEYGMQGHSFDHGAVRMTFNRTQMKTGPGQFKIDPFLIKTGSLDSIIKQTIYEANLFNSERQDLIKIYEDRNAIVVPLLLRIADIEKERKENNDPGQYEDEEDDITKKIDTEDNKLPKLATLQELNKEHADRVLTDIQNGVVTVVKGVQIQQKKEAKNKLKTIIQKLGALNNALEQAPDEDTRNRTLEAREEFQSKISKSLQKGSRENNHVQADEYRKTNKMVYESCK
jgi:hypothetical protein